VRLKVDTSRLNLPIIYDLQTCLQIKLLHVVRMIRILAVSLCICVLLSVDLDAYRLREASDLILVHIVSNLHSACIEVKQTGVSFGRRSL